MDNSADVKLVAVLDYTRAMVDVKEFTAAMKASLQGMDFGKFTELNTQMGRNLNMLEQVAGQIGNSAAEMDKLVGRTNELGRATDETNKKTVAGLREQRALAREQIKNGEYLKKNLEQRLAVQARLDTLLRGQALSEAQMSVVRQRYSATAVSDYMSGRASSDPQSTPALTTQAAAMRAAENYARQMRLNSDAMVDQFRAAQAESTRYYSALDAMESRTARASKQNADAYARSIVNGQRNVEAASAASLRQLAKQQSESERYYSSLETMEARTARASKQNADAYARSYLNGQRNVEATAAASLRQQAKQQAEAERYYRSLETMEAKTARASQENARAYARSYAQGQANAQAALAKTAADQAASQAAYARSVAANGDEMANQFKRHQADQLAAAKLVTAAAVEDLQVGAYKVKTLEAQVRVLRQIAAAENSSIESGRGNLATNTTLRATTTARFGPAAIASYEAGDTAKMVEQLNIEHAKSAANAAAVKAASDTRRAALERERIAAKAAAGDYREFHSAARGLGGASGMLWMTYGSMLPMAAGAGVAGAGIGMAKLGGEMAENMAFVKQLSEDSVPSLEVLDTQILGIRDSLIDMSREGRFGAVQLSESMRVLAQAGFNATQSMAMLPSVNNLSVIGETTPDKAALTVAGSLSAFGLGPDQASRVADVIALAAAKSQTGVEQLMESMKQASSVAQDYGSTIEETGAVLTLLAKRNITGSAAGTAFRNMMVDLGGRTPRSTEAIKNLGVELYDSENRARSTTAVLGDMITKLNELSQEQRNLEINKIFTERGRRAVSSIVGAGEGAFGDLAGDLGRAGDNGGFAARQAAALNTTPIAEYQKAVNNLTASLIEGFNQSETEMKGFAVLMQEAFASNDFKSFVSSISTAMAAMADFARIAGPHLVDLGQMALVYGGVRVAMGAWAAVMAVTTRATLLYNAALGTTGILKRAYAAALAQATVAQTAYAASGSVAAAAGGAVRTGAVAAATGLRALSLAALPVALTVGAIALAYKLFQDATKDPVTIKIDTNELTKPVEYFDYEGIKQQYDGVLKSMLDKSGKFKADYVKNMDDIAVQTIEGEKILSELRTKVLAEYGEDNVAAKQYLVDRERQFYQQLADEAARHHGTSKKDADSLLELATTVAEGQIRAQNAAMDAMALRAEQAIAEQMAAAYTAAGAWETAFDAIAGIKSTFSGFWGGDAKATVGQGMAESARARGDATTKAEMDRLFADVVRANEQGVVMDRGQFARARGLGSFAKGKGIDDVQYKNAVDMQHQISSAATDKMIKDQITGIRGTKTGDPKAAGGGAGRPNRAESNAAKLAADMAKDAAQQAESGVRLQERLNLFVSEEQYMGVEMKRIDAERAEYAAQREKAMFEIARAESSGEGAAAASMREQLVVQDQLQTSKLSNMKADAEAAAVVRQTNKALEQQNILIEGQRSVVSSLTALYGSTKNYNVQIYSQLAAQAAITKARYDSAKQLESLSDAPLEVRMVAFEATRLNLAKQLLEIRREEQKLLFDNAKTGTDMVQSFVNSLSEEIAKLERARTSMADDVVSGLSSGLQAGNKQLFEYIKNPEAFKANNDGQAYGIGNMLGGVGESIFDSVAASLSRSMTQSSLEGIQSLLTSTGLMTPEDAARQQAEQSLAMNTQTMTQALSVAIPQHLMNILAALQGKPITPVGTVGVDGSVAGTDKQGMAGASGEMSKFGQTANSVLSSVGMTTTQAMGMAYMGVNAFATGGSAAFKRFAAQAIAQMLLVYAMQKMIGVAGAAIGGGMGAGGVTAFPVAAPLPMLPMALADGTSYITGPGGSRDDRIPAMLSHGEAVLNATAVDYYGSAMIDKMNRRQLRRNAFADGYNGGGRSASGPSTQETNTASVELHFHGSEGGAQAQQSGGFDKRLVEELEGAVLQVLIKHGKRNGQVDRIVKEIVSR